MEALVILVTEDGCKVVTPGGTEPADTTVLDLAFAALQGGE